MIFDNSENVELLLKYWPVSNHGEALITTRNHTLAYEPAEMGYEVLPFDKESGSQFLLHLLSSEVATDISTQEAQSAYDLADRLSGHALAISQMAGLIHRRKWSIEEFLTVYDRNSQKLFGIPGYNSLDAVWKLSFESLDQDCIALLGVVSFISPDSIPQELFDDDSIRLPDSLRFCKDEFMWAAKEAFFNHSLTVVGFRKS